MPEKFPFDATATNVKQWLGRDDPFIVEVGCNDCRTTKTWLDLMPGARVLAFEPDERPLERNVCEEDERVTIHRIAISDRDGMAEFIPSTGEVPHSKEPCKHDWDMSGSLHRPTGHLQRDQYVKFADAMEIATTRLDYFTWMWAFDPDGRRCVDLIWADVQGAQARLILGAQQTLRRTRYVYMELRPNDQEQYWREPSLEAILAFMPDFDLVATYSNNALLKNREL